MIKAKGCGCQLTSEHPSRKTGERKRREAEHRWVLLQPEDSLRAAEVLRWREIQMHYIKPMIFPSSSMSMSKKQGRVGSPGMVGIFPRMGNRNPAPTLARMSSTEITKSVGAPLSFGSSLKEYCVFAMHIGSLSKPCLVYSSICDGGRDGERWRELARSPFSPRASQSAHLLLGLLRVLDV